MNEISYKTTVYTVPNQSFVRNFVQHPAIRHYERPFYTKYRTTSAISTLPARRLYEISYKIEIFGDFFTTLLGRMKKNLQFDIGFGDAVIPKPQLIDYPVLLDMVAPQVQAYSKESVISEKFEAMITLSVMNSRMKDFYDIYTLLTTNDFDGRILYEAVVETFQRRGTVLEREHPLFMANFAEDEGRTKQWLAFVRRLGIDEPLAFKDVMTCLVDFLEPVYLSLLDEQGVFLFMEARRQSMDEQGAIK